MANNINARLQRYPALWARLSRDRSRPSWWGRFAASLMTANDSDICHNMAALALMARAYRRDANVVSPVLSGLRRMMPATYSRSGTYFTRAGLYNSDAASQALRVCADRGGVAWAGVKHWLLGRITPYACGEAYAVMPVEERDALRPVYRALRGALSAGPGAQGLSSLPEDPGNTGEHWTDLLSLIHFNGTALQSRRTSPGIQTDCPDSADPIPDVSASAATSDGLDPNPVLASGQATPRSQVSVSSTGAPATTVVPAPAATTPAATGAPDVAAVASQQALEAERSATAEAREATARMRAQLEASQRSGATAPEAGTAARRPSPAPEERAPPEGDPAGDPADADILEMVSVVRRLAAALGVAVSRIWEIYVCVAWLIAYFRTRRPGASARSGVTVFGGDASERDVFGRACQVANNELPRPALDMNGGPTGSPRPRW